MRTPSVTVRKSRIFANQQGEYKVRIPFLRRKPTRKQRLAEALTQLMEKWAKQK